MSDRVFFFQRILESDLDDFEARGWGNAVMEHIPSLSEAVCLMTWNGNGEPLNAGKKDDAEKERWDLLLVMLAEQAREVVQGLQYGAKKYNENPDDPNYRRVTDPRRRFGNAALRHLFAAMNGEETDADSGVPHLALAAINCLFLRWHQMKEK